MFYFPFVLLKTPALQKFPTVETDDLHAHEGFQELQLQQEGTHHRKRSIYKHEYLFIGCTASFYSSLCVLSSFTKIISVETIDVKAIIRPQQVLTQRRNHIAAPHHEHQTTSCTKMVHCKPLTHSLLRSAIQVLPCSSVVKSSSIVFYLIHAQSSSLSTSCRVRVHSMYYRNAYYVQPVSVWEFRRNSTSTPAP